MTKQMKDVADIQQFVLAGNATFTLVSEQTGARFTYRVRAPEETRGAVTHFVAALTGLNNEDDFTYLGVVRNAGVSYERGKKSKIGDAAPSARAFAWFWGYVMTGPEQMPSKLQFWHEGKCCRCGRKLTVPESIERGIGPECAGMMGVSLKPVTLPVIAKILAQAVHDERELVEADVQADREGTIRDERRKVARRDDAFALKGRMAASKDYARKAAIKQEQARIACPMTIAQQAPLTGSNKIEDIRAEAARHGITGGGLS